MLDLLLSITSDAVLLFDVDGQIVRANPMAESIFGYLPGELVGKSLETLLPDRFLASHKDLFALFLNSEDHQRRMGDFRQLTGKRKDGTEFPLEASIGRGEMDGKKTAIISLRDISVSEAVRAESELSAMVLRTIGNLVLVSNSAGKIVYVSPSVKRLIGYEPEELLGDGWWEMERLSGGDIETERSYVMRAASGETFADGQPYEHRLRHKDGSWRVFMLADAKGPKDLLIGIGTDITQLKQSEEALRDSEAHYRLAISAADAVPYIVDHVQNKYSFIGDEIERITGFSRDELTPDKFKTIIQESIMRGKFAGITASEGAQRVRRPEDDGVWGCDYRILTKAGESRWLSDTSMPIKSADGEFLGSRGILQDITSRKLVESQLKDQRDLSFQVMNNMGQGLTITEVDSRFVYVNPAYAAMLGYEPSELIGKSSFDMIIPQDQNIFRESQRKRLNGEVSTCEVRLRRKEGGEVFVLITDVQRIADDRQDGFITVVTDLAERRQMENSLRESEEAIRGLYDIASRQEPFENKLRAFLKMGSKRFGLPMGMLASIEDEKYQVVAVETPDNSIQPGDSLELEKTFCLETIRSETPFGFEHAAVSEWAQHPCYRAFKLEAYLGIVVRVAGRNYGTLSFSSHQMRKRPFSDSDKNFISLMAEWVGREIDRLNAASRLQAYATEIEKKNKDLAVARDRALEASYLKSVFLATMSHEIRTPMNAILGMNELLLDTDLDSDQREFASVVGDSAQALLTILNDILDFSKIEAGKLIIKLEPFSPEKLVREAVDLFQTKAEQKGIAINLAIAPVIPAILMGDSGRLRQVIINLLSNAVKFTEEGRVSVDLNGTIIPNGFILVTFTVRDTGIGISEATRERLFEPFTQADDSVTRKYGGTGLGLAISRRLVDLMYGDVGVLSAEGEGSTFWFSVPLGLIPTLDSADSSPKSENGFNVPPIKYFLRFQDQKPALVVDDDDGSRNLMVQQLRTFGLNGLPVVSGVDVIDLVRDNPDDFSIILMDVNMPDLDGLTATRQIRVQEVKAGQHIPIIAITANAMVGDRDICLAAGMDEYLSKPIRLDELGQVLRKFLKKGSEY